MMERIQVGLGDRAYEIVIGPGARALAADLTGQRNFLVTDTRVAELWGSWAAKEIPQAGSFVFPAGERHKTPETVVSICRRAAELRFDRKARFVALGGGVVGDMTGFAAAIYMRGAGFVQIPTTLLAMVDSSVGGKTGVDFDAYKNMVGAFYMPKLVYMNLDVLKTLPKEQFASGMAEALKSGLIRDQEYFIYLCDEIKAIQSLEQEAILRTVSGSCKIKREVVQNDPKEKGERALLNFGHTIGHAIEKLSDFTLYHGECVALGMVAAAYISFKSGNISKEDLEKIEHIISAYNLPIRLKTAKMSADDVLAATKSDKKMEDGRVKFVLLHAIGDAYISREVSDEMLSDGIRYVLQ